MYTYPHTIENGAGEQITFLRRVSGPEGERLEVENCVSPGGGPPMHVHHYQTEALTVVEGRIGYQRPGGQPMYAGPGETVSFPPGDAHRFWNAGDTDLRCRGYVYPPDNVEYFLKSLYESTKRGGGHRPSAFDAAWLTTRYRSEFGLLAVPQLAQRLIFPVLIAIGTLLGKYRRYADAPEPIVR
jgi:quercetin dioxygenase-like cupin family protein